MLATSSTSPPASSGPAWDWSALYGREEESNLLQQLIEMPPLEPSEEQQEEEEAKPEQEEEETGKPDNEKSPKGGGKSPKKKKEDDTMLSSDPNHAGQRLHPGATVLLHGVAGSGKSSLIQAQDWKGWLLVSGKYLAHQEKFQEPFSALIQALNTLIELWITHNETVAICQMGGFTTLLQEDVEFLRHVLPKAYQAVKKKTYSCQAAQRAMKEGQKENTDMARKLENLQVSSVPENDTTPSIPSDAADRVSYQKHRNSSFTMKQDLCTMDCVNASFVRILTFLTQAQPVVLFLDDVQWADAASAKVLHVLATTQPIPNCLLVLSYREEEIGQADVRMQQTIAAIQLYEEDQDHEEEEKTEQENDKEPQPEIQNGEKAVQSEDAPDKKEDKQEDQNPLTDISRPSRRRRRRVYDLSISNLSVSSVNQLVSSLTKRSLDETLPLAEVVHQKTAGNPFFVTQFMQMLRQEDFVRYSYFTGNWEWGDVDTLSSAAHVSENVADIVAATMERLPVATRVALKVAACLGKILPLHVLIQWFDSFFDADSAGTTCCPGLHQIQMQGLQSVLDNAVQVGILIRPKGQEAYMWAHDKLQSVAYSLIPLHFRPQLHLKLGRLLWKMSQQDFPDEEWMVFMAADQMNRYSEQEEALKQQPPPECTDPGYQYYKKKLDQMGDPNSPDNPQILGAEVATLCLEAARLSLAKSALYPAYDMLKAGVKHLDVPNKWNLHYDLCLSLYNTIAELSVQLGQSEQAMEAVEQVKKYAKSYQDKFRVQMVHLKCITAGKDRNYNLGLETSTEILREYGVRMPNKLLPGMLLMECKKTRRRLPGGKLEGLLEYPVMTDPKSRNVIKLLTGHAMYALMSQKKRNRNISWFASLKILSMSADQKAVAEETAMAIVSLGMAHGLQGEFKEANEYGELGLKLMERFPQTVGSIHAMVMVAAAAGIFAFTKPLNKCLDIFLEGHHLGLRTGNTEKAGGAILAYAYTYLTCGLPLAPLQADLKQYKKEVVQFNLPETILAVFNIFEQFILNLQDPGSDPTLLKGEAMDQDEMLASFHGNAHRMTKRDIDSFRIMLALIYGKWTVAEKLLNDLEPFLDNDQYHIRAAMRRCTVALVAFKLSRTNGKRKLRQMARNITKEFREDLKKGNINAMPLYTMLEAEESPSKEGYDKAIRFTAKMGLVHFEAYMCEQAGHFFLEQKDEEWAEFYLAQAVTLNDEWGAEGKAQQLRMDHTRLLRSSLVRERANTALKGRSRYSSSHTDVMMDFDFERLSNNTLNSSTSVSSSSSSLSARSLFTSGTLASATSSLMRRSRADNNTLSQKDDDTMTSSTEDSSEHDGSQGSMEFTMGRFTYTSPLS